MMMWESFPWFKPLGVLLKSVLLLLVELKVTSSISFEWVGMLL